MRSRTDAMARGGIARMKVLRVEGRTLDAIRVANELHEVIAVSAPLNSPEMHVRLRFNFNYAMLLVRDGTQEAIQMARDLLNDIQERIGFHVDDQGLPPALDGERRLSLLSDCSILMNALGDHRQAIACVEGILARAEGAKNLSRIQISLHNLCEYYTQESYEAACAQEWERAELLLAHASTYIERSIREHGQHLTDSHEETREASLLNRLSGKLMVALDRFELSALQDVSPEDALLKLRRLRREAEDLVRRSEANPVVSPRHHTYRYARLGQVLLETARAQQRCRAKDVAAVATIARVFMKQRYDLYVADANPPASLVIRYAEACRLSGDRSAAQETLELGLHRFEIRQGGGHPVCVKIGQLLTSL